MLLVFFSVFPISYAFRFILLVSKKEKVPVVVTITLFLLKGVFFYYVTLSVRLAIPISLCIPLSFIPRNLNLILFIAPI